MPIEKRNHYIIIIIIWYEVRFLFVYLFIYFRSQLRQLCV